METLSRQSARAGHPLLARLKPGAQAETKTSDLSAAEASPSWCTAAQCGHGCQDGGGKVGPPFLPPCSYHPRWPTIPETHQGSATKMHRSRKPARHRVQRPQEADRSRPGCQGPTGCRQPSPRAGATGSAPGPVRTPPRRAARSSVRVGRSRLSPTRCLRKPWR